MSIKVIHYCDGCGNEIKGDMKFIRVEVDPDTPIEQEGDFCSVECIDKWLKEGRCYPRDRTD